jgi:hypothetical protein
MAIDVYLSAGRPANQEQEDFLQAVERFLKQHDLNPLTPGRSHLANKQPLKAVEQCMRTCKGIVVVAYERLYAPLAIERRGGPDKQEHPDAIVPTVWNQVEGAIGYTLGLPVLIIAQKGLRSEALLENKYDWIVQWVDVDAKELLTSGFTGVFADWRNEIDAAEKARAAKESAAAKELADAKALAAAKPAPAPVDYGGRTIAQILGDLKPGQAWKVGLALFALISSMVGYAYKLGVRDGARAQASASSASLPRTSSAISAPTARAR